MIQESSTPEQYRRSLAESGPKKMRALALLAYGDDETRFEAAVLFHEVVRLERQAFKSLRDPSPETRLRFELEQCACLLDGLDPGQALLYWEQDVSEAGRHVSAETWEAMTARLAPRIQEARQSFGGTIQRSPFLQGVWAASTLNAKQKAKVRKELKRLLAQYPGFAHFWFEIYGLDEWEGDLAGAWEAVQKAHRLDPENPIYKAVLHWLAPQMLPADKLAPYYETDPIKMETGMRILLALGTIEALSHGAPVDEALARARKLLRAPLPEPTSAAFADYLHATEKMLEHALEDRVPMQVIHGSRAPGAREMSPARQLATSTIQAMRQKAA